MAPGGSPDGENKLAKAQRENMGCGAGRDPSEGRMQSSAECQSQAVLLAVTSLVSSSGDGGGVG